MQHVLSSLGAALIGAALCCTAAAATSGGEREIAAAIVHATAATKVDTTAGVTLHLHHVINCLVGPQGGLFDAKAEALSENPCHDLGHGALADAGTSKDVHAALTRALRDAESGIRANTLTAGHEDARSALGALEAARQGSRQ